MILDKKAFRAVYEYYLMFEEARKRNVLITEETPWLPRRLKLRQKELEAKRVEAQRNRDISDAWFHLRNAQAGKYYLNMHHLYLLTMPELKFEMKDLEPFVAPEVGVKRRRSLLSVGEENDELTQPLKRQRVTEPVVATKQGVKRRRSLISECDEKDELTAPPLKRQRIHEPVVAPEPGVKRRRSVLHIGDEIDELAPPLKRHRLTVNDDNDDNEAEEELTDIRNDSLCYSDSDDDNDDDDTLFGLSIIDEAEMEEEQEQEQEAFPLFDNNEDSDDELEASDAAVVPSLGLVMDDANEEEVAEEQAQETEAPSNISPPPTQVRRSERLANARNLQARLRLPVLRRSPRLALLPRVSYVGMC